MSDVAGIGALNYGQTSANRVVQQIEKQVQTAIEGNGTQSMAIESAKAYQVTRGGGFETDAYMEAFSQNKLSMNSIKPGQTDFGATLAEQSSVIGKGASGYRSGSATGQVVDVVT